MRPWPVRVATLRAAPLGGAVAALRGALPRGAVAPPPGAARTWLNLQQREATLLGLDAPARIELAAQQEAATALLAHLETLLEPELMERVIDAVSQI